MGIFFSYIEPNTPAFVYWKLLLSKSGSDYDSRVLFIKTVFLADIVSCIRLISFWHKVCLFIDVRSRQGFEEKADPPRPDKKKSLNNNK